MAKKVIDLYLHSGKEDVLEQLKFAGIKLNDEALAVAMYMGYEVKVSYQIDTATGEHSIIGVNDRLLSSWEYEVVLDREDFVDACKHLRTSIDYEGGEPVRHICKDCGEEFAL